MGNIDFKDKKNIYAIAVILLILGAAYCVYTYIWDPFVMDRERLENELQSAQAELDKINAKKHRIAELEMQLVQAEKDFAEGNVPGRRKGASALAGPVCGAPQFWRADPAL